MAGSVLGIASLTSRSRGVAVEQEPFQRAPGRRLPEEPAGPKFSLQHPSRTPFFSRSSTIDGSMRERRNKSVSCLCFRLMTRPKHVLILCRCLSLYPTMINLIPLFLYRIQVYQIDLHRIHLYLIHLYPMQHFSQMKYLRDLSKFINIVSVVVGYITFVHKIFKAEVAELARSLV